MRIVIAYLIALVFAIIVPGPVTVAGLKSATAQTRATPDWFAAVREKSLPWLLGQFMVVGIEPDSGETYRGSVIVRRQGNQLFVQEIINGKTRAGTGRIMPELEQPVLEIEFDSGIQAGYEFRTGDKGQPRASGWVASPRGDFGDRKRLGMEVWYNDEPPPSPALEQIKAAAGDPSWNDLLGLYEGKYRIIGEETSTGRLYTGRVRAKQNGDRVEVKGRADGKVSTGELVFERLPSGKKILVAKLRVGGQLLVSIVHGQTFGDNYPRICGYFYPMNNSRDVIPATQPRLETWFFDWR